MALHAENVREAEKASGLGAMRERLRNFLQAMNDYKYLFEIIPKGDKYLCLLTGVVSFLVKVRHRLHLQLASFQSCNFVDNSPKIVVALDLC